MSWRRAFIHFESSQAARRRIQAATTTVLFWPAGEV
jgi:hypothetical protein